MASSIQILRSSIAKERPFSGSLLDGQPALNTNQEEPGLFFKASDGSIVKIGPAAITSDGNPPNTGGVGQLGNTIGELWLDKSVNPPILKVYDGAQWVNAGSGGGVGQVTLLRWSTLATAGQTVLSGVDSSFQQLAYTAGLEEVYINGAFLRRGVDYTATNGSTIAISAPLALNDEITVLAWTSFVVGSQIVNANVDPSAGIVASKLSFTQAGSGSITRTVDSKLKDVVSVEDFGAVGDGVTDDTAALVAASNYVRGINGTLTFSKRGPYICKQQLFWSYMTVIGCNTVIKFDSLSPLTDCVRIGASRGDKPMTVARLTIDANNTGRDGVYCDGGLTDIGRASDHMMIDQLYVKNAVRDGFVMHTAGAFCWFEDFNISNLAVFECGRHGIRLDCDNFNACFINQGVFINPEVRLIAKTEPGYDVYIRNNCTFGGGKISELTWICGEFDANYPLHGPHSFYFDDTRPGTHQSIGCGAWAFIGCTMEDTSNVISGFPPCLGCSPNTKLDGTQIFGGLIVGYGDAIALNDVDPSAPTTIRMGDRYYDLYPSAPSIAPNAIMKLWFGTSNAMYGESDNVIKVDRGIRPRNLIVGSMIPTAAVTNTIHISNTAAPTINPSGGGILFVEGGALKFRGSAGTVTTIAPA